MVSIELQGNPKTLLKVKQANFKSFFRPYEGVWWQFGLPDCINFLKKFFSELKNTRIEFQDCCYQIDYDSEISKSQY